MNENQYLLTFDLSEITQNVSELQSTYSALSQEVYRTNEASADLVDRLGSKLDNISNKLTNSLQGLDSFYEKVTANFSHMLSIFKDIDKYSTSISGNLKNLGSIDISKLSSQQTDTIEDRLNAVSPGSFVLSMDVSASGNKAAEEALSKAQKALDSAKKAVKETEQAKTLLERAKDVARKEAQSVVDTVKGMTKKGASGLGLQNFGGGPLSVFSSLASLIFLGVQWNQRIQAERGEMLNAAEAAGGIFKAGVQKGIDQISAFGEHAQWQFGISRKEVQKVVSSLANIGIQIDETLTGIYRSEEEFKDVTKSVITLSLAIDKNLEISGGTSMERAISLVENYGYSIEDAVMKIRNLSMSAKTSGMDIQKFISAVLDSSASLVQYQIDAEDVASVLVSVKDRYESMGIDSKRSGALAAKVTGEMAGAFDNLREGVKMGIAQSLYPGEKDPMRALLKLQDRFMSVKASGDKQDQQNLLLDIWNAFKSEGVSGLTGDYTSDRIIMQQSHGMSPQLADAILNLPKDLKNLDAPGKAALEALGKAFTVQGDTLTELQKTQKDIVGHLAKMGEHAIGVVVGIHNVLVAGFKSLIAMMQASSLPSGKRQEVMDRIYEKMNEESSYLSSNFKGFFSEAGEAIGAGSKFFKSQVEAANRVNAWDPMEGIKRAPAFNPFTTDKSQHNFDNILNPALNPETASLDPARFGDVRGKRQPMPSSIQPKVDTGSTAPVSTDSFSMADASMSKKESSMSVRGVLSGKDIQKAMSMIDTGMA